MPSMEPLAQLSWNLPSLPALEEAADALRKQYTLSELPAQTTQRTFVDSFDWRLYQQNRLCFFEDKNLFLIDFSNRVRATPLPIEGHLQRFWQQLPLSPIREALADILEMRAFLPQAECIETSRELRVLNKEEKIVARLFLLEIDSGVGSSIYSIQLHEVRGYQKWFFKINNTLEKFGKPQPCTTKHLLQTLLAHRERVPLDYSSKLTVKLKPNMAAQSAVKQIYRYLLTTMQQNEHGILTDIDSEFLHDFRVAIRRTRSGLALIKGVLETEINTRFKEKFRYLGKITSPVRDLDVYLLMEEDYKTRLPGLMQEGLQYFFEDLAVKRAKEQRKLVKKLTSSKYQAIIQEWQGYLEEQEQQRKTKGEKGQAIGPMADEIIKKRLRRLLTDGQAIQADSADEELHELRIEGKKLRYALEFFHSLYPSQEIKQLLKQLKLLQNNLGLFNDLSVQQEMLSQYLTTLNPGSVRAKKMSAAIGGLLTNLHHEQQQVRLEFAQCFKEFSSKKNLALHRRLFQLSPWNKKK
ncbi:MAG: CHAD domain-containing protein [Candidatus Electrothrix sp. AR3]|nr:CHAD domain-containing protein [Candidatus Electrothrix sp. AR3]